GAEGPGRRTAAGDDGARVRGEPAAARGGRDRAAAAGHHARRPDRGRITMQRWVPSFPSPVVEVITMKLSVGLLLAVSVLLPPAARTWADSPTPLAPAPKGFGARRAGVDR